MTGGRPIINDINAERIQPSPPGWADGALLPRTIIPHTRAHPPYHPVWSNFEIADLDLWRSEAYMKFFEFLDSKGWLWTMSSGIAAEKHAFLRVLFLQSLRLGPFLSRMGCMSLGQRSERCVFLRLPILGSGSAMDDSLGYDGSGEEARVPSSAFFPVFDVRLLGKGLGRLPRVVPSACWDDVSSYRRRLSDRRGGGSGERVSSNDTPFGKALLPLQHVSGVGLPALSLLRAIPPHNMLLLLYIDELMLKGFYYERWGDAPVHSIGAALFARKDQIHFFEDIGYRHEPFQHCPQLQHAKNRCSCDINDNFDRDARPCLNRYDRIFTSPNFPNV
ncbi:hypothetical protein C8J57DRAFT_1241065 [Mycena rebaudengoi]|nr:hypothetical protein C8J57DRAFT_1241065 [Mycena rebaudengoi]